MYTHAHTRHATHARTQRTQHMYARQARRARTRGAPREDVREDLKVRVRVHGEPLPRRHGVVVKDPQDPKRVEPPVAVLGKAEREAALRSERAPHSDDTHTHTHARICYYCRRHDARSRLADGSTHRGQCACHTWSQPWSAAPRSALRRTVMPDTTRAAAAMMESTVPEGETTAVAAPRQLLQLLQMQRSRTGHAHATLAAAAAR